MHAFSKESISTALIVGIGWLISLCFHEFSHALIAYAGGDKSVKEKGYLTLNPLRYTDPGLTLVLPLVILMLGGIALPGAAVFINTAQLRNRGWQSLVSLAGPAANVICLLALSFAFHFRPAHSTDTVWSALALLALFQTVATLLNSLPIPPLDGFGVIDPWLPTPLRKAARSFARYGIILLFAALWFIQPLNNALWIAAYIINELLGFPYELTEIGHQAFRSGTIILMVIILSISVLNRRQNRTSAT